MREDKPRPGSASSLFVPIFVGGMFGWFAPYMLLNSPLTGDRFLDGVIGLVSFALIGGVVGAILKRR